MVKVLLVKLPAYTLQPADIEERFIEEPLLNIVTPLDVVAGCNCPMHGYVPLNEVTFISVLLGTGYAALLNNDIDEDAFNAILPPLILKLPDCDG